MINEKELEELKEKICKLAAKPRPTDWLKKKTGAAQELFDEALDDLTDSRHIKESDGRITAVKVYDKSKTTVNYCPKCGSRVVGDECPVCRAKVSGQEHHTVAGKLVTIVVVTFLLVAFLGVVSTPRMAKAPDFREVRVVEEYSAERGNAIEGYPAEMVEATKAIHEPDLFYNTKFVGGYCEEKEMPIVYYFGIGNQETEKTVIELTSQFPVSLHSWPDAYLGKVSGDIGVMKEFGELPMILFGCRYVTYGNMRWDQSPQATAILCDLTGHASERCKDYQVEIYLKELYSIVGR